MGVTRRMPSWVAKWWVFLLLLALNIGLELAVDHWNPLTLAVRSMLLALVFLVCVVRR